MPAWAQKITAGGAATAEWFLTRFAEARALMTAAGVPAAENFDTIIPAEFAETITSELVDVDGVADASPENFYNGGVVRVTVGDDVLSPNHARLQLTSPPSHVGSLAEKRWYAASLFRFAALPAGELGDTAADAIGLWGDDDNRVGLGVNGLISGGSTTNFVGYAFDAASSNSALGPALDTETQLWHLAAMWFDGEALHFYIDGEEFGDTIPVADLPDVPATLSMMFDRTAVGEPVAVLYDKACVIVRSPVVGETS